jgi:hypothetical protein
MVVSSTRTNSGEWLVRERGLKTEETTRSTEISYSVRPEDEDEVGDW